MSRTPPPGLRRAPGATVAGCAPAFAVAALPAAPKRTAAERAQVARMLAAGRAVWTIVAPEEAQDLRSGADTPVSALRKVRPSLVPPGPTRHLHCNRTVPDDWLTRFDSALAPPR